MEVIGDPGEGEKRASRLGCFHLRIRSNLFFYLESNEAILTNVDVLAFVLMMSHFYERTVSH